MAVPVDNPAVAAVRDISLRNGFHRMEEQIGAHHRRQPAIRTIDRHGADDAHFLRGGVHLEIGEDQAPRFLRLLVPEPGAGIIAQRGSILLKPGCRGAVYRQENAFRGPHIEIIRFGRRTDGDHQFRQIRKQSGTPGEDRILRIDTVCPDNLGYQLTIQGSIRPRVRFRGKALRIREDLRSIIGNHHDAGADILEHFIHELRFHGGVALHALPHHGAHGFGNDAGGCLLLPLAGLARQRSQHPALVRADDHESD